MGSFHEKNKGKKYSNTARLRAVLVNIRFSKIKISVFVQCYPTQIQIFREYLHEKRIFKQNHF